jgi:hypothetical protein
MEIWPDTPFTAAQLTELGRSSRQLRDAVADGAVRMVHRGVYARGDLPDTTELRARAAMLVAPSHVVVTDHSASWIHGVDAFDPTALDLPPDLEVVSVGGNDRTRRSGVLGGKRTLNEEDVCVIEGIRLTTTVRTACDLACLRGRYAALAVLDAFMRIHGVTRQDYERVAMRFTGRRGVRQLRELIALATELAESMGESWTRMAIHDAGLPAPQPQVWVLLAGFGRVRLDLAYRFLKIVVEYDGEEFHSSDEDKEADRKRRKALRDAGWFVIVVTKHDFAGEALDAWLIELRGAIQERQQRPGRRYARAVTDERPRRRARG